MIRRTCATVAVIVCCWSPATTTAQSLPSTTPIDAWGPNGTVTAIARSGDTLYVGGFFDYVGPATGPFVVVDPATGASISVPQLSGRVALIAPVPGGGWVLSGYFVLRGDATPTRTLVRLDATGAVVSSWLVTVDGVVSFLAVGGDAVYLGGSLSAVNRTTRKGLAAVDLVTGALLPFEPIRADDPNPGFVSDGLLYAGVVYVLGEFREGVRGPQVASIDLATGTFRPVSTGPVARVIAMSAVDGTLYLTGYSTSSASAGAKVAVATGVASAWNVSASLYVSQLVATSAAVFARAAAPDVAGNSVVALDPASGVQVGPPLASGGFAIHLALGAAHLFVSRQLSPGAFDVVALPLAAPAVTAWTVFASDSVDGVAESGARLAIAGVRLRSVGGVKRSRLFAMDLRTGRPTSFAPAVSSVSVFALAVVGNVLVTGLQSAEFEGVHEPALAAFDRLSGQSLSWSPVGTGIVFSLAADGRALYVGGNFLLVDGVSRPYLAAISLATGHVTTWLPVPDRPISAVSVTESGVVAVGRFTTVAAAARGAGAVFVGTDLNLGPWNPEAAFGVHSETAVADVATAAGRIAIAGPFDLLKGRNAAGFGVFDAAGALLPIAAPPRFFKVASVSGLGTQFLIGGPIASVAIVSALTGADLGWSPPFDGENFPGVYQVERYADFAVVAGRFDSAGGRPVLNLAIFPSAGPPPPERLRVNVTGSAVSLGWDAPAGTTPSSYLVDATSGGTTVGPIRVTSTTIRGTLAAGTYALAVRAVEGGVTGASTNPIAITVPAPAVVPPAPTSLAGAAGAGMAQLTWTPGASSADSGNLERYVIEAGTAPGLTDIAAIDTGVIDTLLVAPAPAGTYYVRVRAKNAFGVSAPSNEVVLVVP